MPKFCQYCGTPLQEGARFCTKCGHPVAQTAQPFEQNTYDQNQYDTGNYPPQQPSYAQQPPQQAYAYGGQMPYQQPPKRKGGCGKVALIVILVIIAVVGAGVYFLYKYAAEEFEDAKEKMVETMGQSFSSMLNSEDSEGNTEMADQNEKTDKPEKGKGSKKIAVKDEDFFGVALPFPDMGEITTNFSDRSGSIETKVYYFDKISYQQFIEYCKMLEALPGWVAHEEDNVAHFPKDYNKKMMTMCVGDYNGLHIVVSYLSDSFIEGTDRPHFALQVKNKG